MFAHAAAANGSPTYATAPISVFSVPGIAHTPIPTTKKKTKPAMTCDHASFVMAARPDRPPYSSPALRKMTAVDAPHTQCANAVSAYDGAVGSPSGSTTSKAAQPTAATTPAANTRRGSKTGRPSFRAASPATMRAMPLASASIEDSNDTPAALSHTRGSCTLPLPGI